jgi:HPt (histidine-containing phosphotransfer) domain-containing protein
MEALTYDPGGVVELFGETDARELLGLALADLQGRLGTLRQHLEAGETALAAKAAHSIAGVSGNVMAMTLSDSARELEGALLEGHGVSDALVEAVVDEGAAVLSTIETFLA